MLQKVAALATGLLLLLNPGSTALAPGASVDQGAVQVQSALAGEANRGLDSPSAGQDVVRVNLASMGVPIEVNLIVQGNYTIGERPDIPVERRSYRIRLENGQLLLDDGNVSHALGSSFTLRWHGGPEPGHLHVQDTTYGWVNYPGDMQVLIRNGAIAMVNHVPLETYLYGVVPSEMPNGWSIEALKAQAVAARTRAKRSRHVNRASFADLCNTQLSQVYRGVNPQHLNAMQAVDQTAGQVLKHGGELLIVFYSSSNGGTIEASSNVWSGAPLPYSNVMPDPFDARNTLNPHAQWVFELPKSPVPAAVQTGIAGEIGPLLAGQGYSTSVPDIIVREIRGLSFGPPNASGRITSGHLTVLLEVVRSSEQPRELLEKTVLLERSAIRRALTLRSLLFTMTDAGDRFTFTGRGFGHGVGMSQHGARQMAIEQHSFEQILSFYYPGTQLVALTTPTPTPTTPPPTPTTPPPTPTPDTPTPTAPPPTPTPDTPTPTPTPTAPTPTPPPPTPTPTATPTATPTPPPTPTPATPRARYGIVTAAALNVRSGPGLNHPRIRTLGRGTVVLVTGQAGGWARVAHGPLQGHVLAAHLRLFPVIGRGTVTTSRVNVRSGPGLQHARVASVVGNTRVDLLEQVGAWYRIAQGSISGFVDGRFLSVSMGSP